MTPFGRTPSYWRVTSMMLLPSSQSKRSVSSGRGADELVCRWAGSAAPTTGSAPTSSLLGISPVWARLTLPNVGVPTADRDRASRPRERNLHATSDPPRHRCPGDLVRPPRPRRSWCAGCGAAGAPRCRVQHRGRHGFLTCADADVGRSNSPRRAQLPDPRPVLPPLQPHRITSAGALTHRSPPLRTRCGAAAGLAADHEPESLPRTVEV